MVIVHNTVAAFYYKVQKTLSDPINTVSVASVATMATSIFGFLFLGVKIFACSIIVGLMLPLLYDMKTWKKLTKQERKKQSRRLDILFYINSVVAIGGIILHAVAQVCLFGSAA